MAAPTATVIRDGQEKEISAEELVPGDIIVLATGDKIPADARLIEAVNLRIQESALTGESLASEKITDALAGETLPVGDRKNMVYAGTSVSVGRGKAVITATGLRTEFGRIAGLLTDIETDPTPLQKDLDHVGKSLAKAALGIVMVICD